MKFLGRSVSPRRLSLTLLTVAVVFGGALALWLLALSNRPLEEGIDYADFSADSTATVVFAGEFPPLERDPMFRPLAIDGDGERMFVVESNPGQISVRGYDGSLLETFTIPAAQDAPGFFPIDVAVLDDGRLGVVDAAAARVVIVDPDDPETFELLDEGPAMLQPTSIEASGGLIAVADAGDASVRVYDADGGFERVLGRDLQPQLTFVGGMLIDEAVIWIADSNAGRVIGLDPRTGEMITSLQQRFDLPRGIALSLGSRLSIVDTFAREVVLFDPVDQVIADIVANEDTERFDEGGQLDAPESAFWDATEDRLYVVDPGQGRVKVYGVREAPAQ